MSSVLYYSKYCKNCDDIIGKLSKTSIQKDIHVVCIDKRVKEGNKIYLLLDLIASLFLWLIMPIFYHIAKKKGRI